MQLHSSSSPNPVSVLTLTPMPGRMLTITLLVKDGSFTSVKPLANLQQPGLEAIWLELRKANSPQRPLIVCATYRPPGGTLVDIQAYSDGLEDCLLSLNLSVSTLLLTGDFNAHNSSWLAGDRTTPVGQ